jgi:hypothetical protein
MKHLYQEHLNFFQDLVYDYPVKPLYLHICFKIHLLDKIVFILKIIFFMLSHILLHILFLF